MGMRFKLVTMPNYQSTAVLDTTGYRAGRLTWSLSLQMVTIQRQWRRS